MTFIPLALQCKALFEMSSLVAKSQFIDTPKQGSQETRGQEKFKTTKKEKTKGSKSKRVHQRQNEGLTDAHQQ